MGLRSDSDDANDDAFLWCILHNNKCSNGLYSTLKGDYGKTTLSSLHWREIFSRCPQYRNIWKQGQTTTPGGMFTTLCVKCMGSSTSPVN